MDFVIHLSLPPDFVILLVISARLNRKKNQSLEPTAKEPPIDGWIAPDELEHASSERESKTTKEVAKRCIVVRILFLTSAKQIYVTNAASLYRLIYIF